MSAYEQKIEPPDRHWQYLLFAAEPYETIGFKIPSREVDKAEGKFWTLWNRESKQFFLQFAFRVESNKGSSFHSLPSSSSASSTTTTTKSTMATTGNQSTIESPSTTTMTAGAENTKNVQNND